jgi:hypothetical protein
MLVLHCVLCCHCHLRLKLVLLVIGDWKMELGWPSQYRDYAMGWMIRLQFPAGALVFFSLHHHTHILPSQYWGAIALGMKWSGCEADHSPSSSAKDKNLWSYMSAPQYIFMKWCLIASSCHGALFSTDMTLPLSILILLFCLCQGIRLVYSLVIFLPTFSCFS